MKSSKKHGKGNRIVSSILATATAVQLMLIPASAVVVFSDMPRSTWYYVPVMQASNLDLMQGFPDGTFGPEEPVTRGQVVQILYNRYGQNYGRQSGFSDVPKTAWYAQAVTWAHISGLVGGLGNGKFGPESNLTREQLVSILYAKAGRPAVNANAILARYVDYSSISDWARPGFAWAVNTGLIKGVGKNMLDPKGTTTRAQTAAIITRYLEKVDHAKLPSIDIAQ